MRLFGSERTEHEIACSSGVPREPISFISAGRVARATLTRVPHATFVWLHGGFRRQCDSVPSLGYFPNRKRRKSKPPPNQMMVGRGTPVFIDYSERLPGPPATLVSIPEMKSVARAPRPVRRLTNICSTCAKSPPGQQPPSGAPTASLHLSLSLSLLRRRRSALRFRLYRAVHLLRRVAQPTFSILNTHEGAPSNLRLVGRGFSLTLIRGRMPIASRFFHVHSDSISTTLGSPLK